MSDGQRLTDLTVGQLLEQLSSSAPVPGGGSAAALAGAMGAALVGMVAQLTLGREAYAAVQEEIRDIDASAARLRAELLDLAERDADAYAAVVRARRMPRNSEERTTGLAAATLEATRVPLRAAEVALEVLALARRIAPIGNGHAISDVGVAAQLASACIRGAALNVHINVPSLAADEPMRRDAPARLDLLTTDALREEVGILAIVTERMG